jgi:cephalosporin hydroxylase
MSVDQHSNEVAGIIARNAVSKPLLDASEQWMLASLAHRYSYCFRWLGRPVIQYPQDIMALQELIWQVRPDLVIETGIAHGGSLIFSASMLALLDYCDATASGSPLDPSKPRRTVLGIDIDIRDHNRTAIEAHPMAQRIRMIEGSSVDPKIVAEARIAADGKQSVLVVLDSNHTHEHVLAELEAYAPMVTRDSYCVVFDTVIEDMPAEAFPDRPWGPGNNPKTAVHAWVAKHPEFRIDRQIQDKLQLTAAPDGYLRRIS